jgi:hypothetical protein
MASIVIQVDVEHDIKPDPMPFVRVADSVCSALPVT